MAATISAMKFALMPMMVTREMASIARTTVKVAPSAPKFAPCILAGEVGFGGVFGLAGWATFLSSAFIPSVVE